jgi:hypothetical protein
MNRAERRKNKFPTRKSFLHNKSESMAKEIEKCSLDAANQGMGFLIMDSELSLKRVSPEEFLDICKDLEKPKESNPSSLFRLMYRKLALLPALVRRLAL